MSGNLPTETGLSYDALVMLLVDVQEGKFQPEPIVDALRELIDRRADERVAATLESASRYLPKALSSNLRLWLADYLACMEEILRDQHITRTYRGATQSRADEVRAWLSSSPVETNGVPDWLAQTTFRVEYNANCPSPYLVRLVKQGKIFGDERDACGYGQTIVEAAEAARAELKTGESHGTD